jgi:hypothetical protein
MEPRRTPHRLDNSSVLQDAGPLASAARMGCCMAAIWTYGLLEQSRRAHSVQESDVRRIWRGMPITRAPGTVVTTQNCIERPSRRRSSDVASHRAPAGRPRWPAMESDWRRGLDHLDAYACMRQLAARRVAACTCCVIDQRDESLPVLCPISSPRIIQLPHANRSCIFSSRSVICIINIKFAS